MVTKIEITDTAKENLKDNFWFYRRIANETIAKKVVDHIKSAILTIPLSPFKGAIEDKHVVFRENNIRKIVVKHFKIYYMLTETSILIMAIFDTRQHPDKLNF